MARIIEVKNYIDPFYTYINKLMPVKKELVVPLMPFLEIKLFERKMMILQEGEVDAYLNLVMKGMVRKYLQFKNGRQVTMQLATEGHFIQSEISYNIRKPSEVAMDAVESSILIRMSHKKMDEMFELYPWTEELGRHMTTEMAIRKDDRYYNLLKKTPRERFLDYLATHPHMLQRVPQKVLASYLNIKPETFSRLKHFTRKKTG